MINKERLLNLFMELVQIDSVSKEERELADRIIIEFDKIGLEVIEDDTATKIDGNAGNLIIDIAGDQSLSCFLLSAHLDRVEPGRGIKPVIKEGYVVTEGDTVLAGDDLIGVAAIIEVVKILKEKNIKHRPFKIVFTVAEEIGLQGAKNLDFDQFKMVDYGFVFDVDGAVGTVVHQAPTQTKFNAVINGKSAHAGIEPSRGVNAIKIASLAISNMNLGQVNNETTANIGVIRGGRASNIVPDMVELEGEIRSHSAELLEKQQEDMKILINRSCEKYCGKVYYDIEEIYCAFAISSESDIIKIVENIIEGLGLDFVLTKSGGGSDANVFNNKGLTTLNLGVGMENVHSTEERVKIQNLNLTAEFILKLLTEEVKF
ncbi:MAG: M20/M25/M40 family metallo-hydrolase [Halanaerobiales bacterium]